MKKVLFIIPPHITYESFRHPAFNERQVHKKSKIFGSVLTDMPLGVLSLSSYIKKYYPVRTHLIDFNIVLNKAEEFKFDTFEDFFMDFFLNSQLEVSPPDIIGIAALFTPSYQNMLEVAKCCRKLFPTSLITAGGGVPTNMYQEIFQNSDCIDAICFGEGEKPLLNLLEADNVTEFFESNKSWITKKKVHSNETFQFDFVNNLDEIPFPDYSILEPKDYGLNPAITAYAGVKEKLQNFHVMTSRGCIHHCCFCSSHTVHGRTMRYFSIGRVKEDFIRLREQYGAKVLVFQDDHLMSDVDRAIKIIEIVHELKMRAVFQNSLALYALNRKVLELMKNAGVDQLMLSVESGSERVLNEIMHKPLNLNIVKSVVNDCRELGIYTNVNILIGLPGENKDDIEDTRKFLMELEANWFLFFCATPLVGSEMFDICHKKNYFERSHIGCDYKNAIISTEDFTADYIQEKTYSLNLELNFVNNSDFRLGHYKTALLGFENAIKAKDDHALAYYFAAKCCLKLGMNEIYQKYSAKYKEIVRHSEFWYQYSKQFGIPFEV